MDGVVDMTCINVNKDQGNPNSTQDLTAVSSMLPPQQQNGAKVQMLPASVPASLDISTSLTQLNSLSENNTMLGEGNPSNPMGRTSNNPEMCQMNMGQARGRGRGRASIGRAMGRMPPRGGRIPGRGQSNIFQQSNQPFQQPGNLPFSASGGQNISAGSVSNTIAMNNAGMGLPGRGRGQMRPPNLQQQHSRGRGVMGSSARGNIGRGASGRGRMPSGIPYNQSAGTQMMGGPTSTGHGGPLRPGSAPGQQLKSSGALGAGGLYQPPQSQAFTHSTSQSGGGQMPFPGGRPPGASGGLSSSGTGAGGLSAPPGGAGGPYNSLQTSSYGGQSISRDRQLSRPGLVGGPGGAGLPSAGQAPGLGGVAGQPPGSSGAGQNSGQRIVKLVGGWQSDNDKQSRRKMIARIMQLLNNRKPNARPEWKQKVPSMARRLEDSLYRSAASYAEYSDLSTLKNRLQQLAIKLGIKAQEAKQKAVMMHGSERVPGGSGPGNMLPTMGGSSLMGSGGASGMNMMNAPNMGGLSVNIGVNHPGGGQAGMGAGMSASMQGSGRGRPNRGNHGNAKLKLLQDPNASDQDRRFVNMSDINPLMGGNTGNGGNSGGSGLAQGMGGQFQGGMDGSNHGQMNGANSESSHNSQSRQPQRFTPEQKKLALKQQQQRLLLLRHASRCPTNPPQHCQYTESCGRMKKLWKHISNCKDQQCQTSHCVSSRYLLSHYHRCTDDKCPVCSPVREAIKRNQIRKAAALAQANAQPGGSNSGAPPMMPGTLPLQPSVSGGSQFPPNLSAQASGGDNSGNGGVIGTGALANGASLASSVSVETGMGTTANGLNTSAGTQIQPGTSGNLASNGPGIGGFSSGMPLDGTGSSQHAGQNESEHRDKRVKLETDSSLGVGGIPGQPQPSGAGSMGGVGLSGNGKPFLGTGGVSQMGPGGVSPKLGAPSGPGQTDISGAALAGQVKPELNSNALGGALAGGSSGPSSTNSQSLKVESHLLPNKINYTLPQSGVQNGGPQIKSEPAGGLSSPVMKSSLSSGGLGAGGSSTTSGPSGGPVGGIGSSNASSGPPGLIKPEHLPGASGPQPTPQPARPHGKYGKTMRGKTGKIPHSDAFLQKAKNQTLGRQTLVITGREGRADTPQAGLEDAEDGTSLVQGFTIEQIETHIKSLEMELNLPIASVKQYCTPVLKMLLDHQYGWIFDKPVDPIGLGLVDYFEIIKCPMDLGTVKKKLENNVHRSIESFRADVELTFNNAMLYNQEGTDVHVVAKDMLKLFKTEMSKVMRKISDAEEKKKTDGEACSLCGQTKLTFEPMVFYCNGVSCAGNRIRRNANFFTGGNNRYHWCQGCYNELKENEPIVLLDCTLKREDLQKKRNNEVHEEPWVECDNCKRWVHQVCALFNSRKNSSDQNVYFCPRCTIQKRKAVGKLEPTGQKASAANLPDTALSKYIQEHVEKQLKMLYEHQAEELNVPLEKVEKSPPIYIKQVSCIDKPHYVRDHMRNRYKDRGYPQEFPVRIKCLVLFQELDGVDVILFGMYLYEYGHQCMRPNQRSVYISYLDSVHYFRPRQYRTKVYHEMLVSYLEYVKKRGFNSCYIWACPPLKGDDYILYCHPEDQKTPKDDRLRAWYQSMLDTAKERGIVTELNNLFDEYFTDPSRDPTCLPYFEGDYWVGEAENIIKTLNDEAMGLREARKDKRTSKAKATSKAKGNKKAGRRMPVLQEDGTRDPLMVRLGNNIEPMKESFFVAYMQPKEKRDADWARYQLELEMEEIKTNKDESNPKYQEAQTFAPQPDETEDVDEAQECEFFDNRQAFLNLCQGNHYQYDTTRRAKHSSMMVLYHLYNPDAPKFLMNCSQCLKEIVTGKRHSCNQCTEFHLCDTCHANGPQHCHPLQAVSVRAQETKGQITLTQEQREARRRTIHNHMQLLYHSSKCENNDCISQNCKKMKKLLEHLEECKVRPQGGCSQCRKMYALLTFHSRMCQSQNCKVPKCKQLKEKYRVLAQQQLKMDDRRRTAMNQAYQKRADGIQAAQGASSATSGGSSTNAADS